MSAAAESIKRTIRRNKYTWLHIKIMLRALSQGKITPKKLLNLAWCNLAYFLKSERTSTAPYMASIELWNECNANCLFCRNKKGEIYDVNPDGTSEPIMKGKMPVEMAEDIILQLKDYLLIAVLYTNGEPLIYKDLPRVIKFASEHKVPTMVSSNGMPLNEKRARDILEAGLDFIKIQLGGFTQDIYSIQIRNGHVDKLKENIRRLAELKKAGGYGTIILIDWISYKYNEHQLPLVKAFCKELGLMLSIRPGNPKNGLEDKEPALTTEELPLKMSCDWLWKAMQINWNGDVLQCCESVVWSKPDVYEKLMPGRTKLLDVWNGPQAREMRRNMTQKGRGAIPICAGCTRKGVTFKW